MRAFSALFLAAPLAAAQPPSNFEAGHLFKTYPDTRGLKKRMIRLREKNIAEWVEDQSRSMRWIGFDGTDIARFQAELAKGIGKLLVQVTGFANQFVGMADSGKARQDYRIEYDRDYGGISLVILAQRTGYDLTYERSYRETVAVGAGLPLWGRKSTDSDDPATQVTLRVLPFSINSERFSVRPDPVRRIQSPENGFMIRPTVELEATHVRGPTRSGLRMMIQSRIEDPDDIRLLSEAFVEYRIWGGMRTVSSINLVPRCMFDLSQRMNDLAQDTRAGPFSALYSRAGESFTCTLSTQMVWQE